MAPDKDGGSPITGYDVERKEASSTKWIKINKIAVKVLASRKPAWNAVKLYRFAEYKLIYFMI